MVDEDGTIFAESMIDCFQQHNKTAVKIGLKMVLNLNQLPRYGFNQDQNW